MVLVNDMYLEVIFSDKNTKCCILCNFVNLNLNEVVPFWINTLYFY